MTVTAEGVQAVVPDEFRRIRPETSQTPEHVVDHDDRTPPPERGMLRRFQKKHFFPKGLHPVNRAINRDRDGG